VTEAVGAQAVKTRNRLSGRRHDEEGPRAAGGPHPPTRTHLGPSYRRREDKPEAADVSG